MQKIIEDEIIQAEENLRQAMLASDVEALEELLSPELIFTTHTGQVVGKQDDLAAHRSGLFTLEKLVPSEQRLKILGESNAIFSVRMRLSGKFAGAPIEGDFRYTRVWLKSKDGKWRIAAGHACIVQT